VMNKDRQDAAQKRQAIVRLPDPRREAKRARGSTKAAAAGGSQLTLAAKPAAPGSSKVSESTKVVVAGGTNSTQGEAAKVRELPSPGKRVANFGMNISVDDYFVGKYVFFDSWYVAGSGEGQMVVVPPAVATTASTALVGAKGGAFCASGEISSAAAVKDEAGTMSRRLREASQQLSQVS
jgi:hypothetical protein